MKFKLLLVFVLGLVLAGCNGARVVDNVYDGGNRQYVISQDLTYVGEAPRTSSNNCVGLYCARTYGKTSSRSISDLFVRMENNKAQEAVILTKLRAAGGFYFGAISGSTFALDGVEYTEFFNKVGKNDGAPYKNYIEGAGYDASDDDYYVISLVRNTSETTRVAISYACTEKLFPDGVVANSDEGRAFLRGRIQDRVTVR